MSIYTDFSKFDKVLEKRASEGIARPSAPIRNKVLEFIESKGSVTHRQIRNWFSKVSEETGETIDWKWVRTNSHLIDSEITEEGKVLYSLTKRGLSVLETARKKNTSPMNEDEETVQFFEDEDASEDDEEDVDEATSPSADGKVMGGIRKAALDLMLSKDIFDFAKVEKAMKGYLNPYQDQVISAIHGHVEKFSSADGKKIWAVISKIKAKYDTNENESVDEASGPSIRTVKGTDIQIQKESNGYTSESFPGVLEVGSDDQDLYEEEKEALEAFLENAIKIYNKSHVSYRDAVKLRRAAAKFEFFSMETSFDASVFEDHDYISSKETVAYFIAKIAASR